MTTKNPKTVKFLIFIIAFCVIGGFAVNWFLTYRFQSTLKKTLTEEVLKATDGFYRCTFEELSVGLFSGELSIRGVNLEPDSAAFIQWQSGDTLPNVYYKAHIGEIHFRGVNLTWLWSYSDLHFSLFELSSPDVKIIQPVFSKKQKDKPGKELKTLYEVIAPYIQELTVNRINLKDANVSYIVEDSVSPVIYGLRDVNFTAYKFRLDKNSALSGKLLYSDQFEFEADKPQQLLYSDQIILETDNIKLSTIESLIKIEGVKIRPEESFWESRSSRTGTYLKTEISSVTAEGVGLERENGQNYLHASTFNIASTNIDYYSFKGINQPEEKDFQPSDSTVDQTWSLYSLISPILSSISIDKIDIDKTKFNYTLTQKGQTDIYTLYEFDFHANKLLIDSLSEQHKKFWYVDNFALTGANINGLMESNNSNVSATQLYLNTAEKQFHISDIDVKPLSTSSGKDYMSGGIKRISIDGLDYNNGVSADELRVDTFNIEYFKVSANKQQKSTSKTSDSPEDIFEMFNPYADFLSVKKINLKDASMIVHNRREKETYRLQHLNFYATDFRIDENTRRNSRYLFTCDDIGLTFKNFDNILPGGIYRLKIGNADVSTLAGRIKFNDVRLIPQTETWKKAPDSYLSIATPLIEMKGFDNDVYMSKENVKIKSFQISSPDISIVKLRNTSDLHTSDSVNQSILSLLKNIYIDSVKISNAKVQSFDRTKNDTVRADLLSLKLMSFDWDISKKMNIKEFALLSPHVDYTTHQAEKKDDSNHTRSKGKGSLSLLGDNITVGKFTISDPQVNISQPDSKIMFKTSLFSLMGLNWSANNLALASLDLIRPNISLIQDYIIDMDTTESKASAQMDIYTTLTRYFDKANIGRINIEGAGIDYSHTMNKKIVKHQEVSTANLKVDNLQIDSKARTVDVADFDLMIKDLHLPIMDGFYTLDFDKIALNKKNAIAEISGMKMTSTYPKMDFSYIHPTHADWFDVSVGNILLTGVDYNSIIKKGILKAGDFEMKDVVLQNLKNKQIYTPPKMQPMIYKRLHDLPIGLDIDTANIKNFTVIYDELPKGSTEMGRILFEGMDARISKLSNIPSFYDEYMHLDIDGKFMGGPFTAGWDIPVNKDYDCFVLSANLKNFDMKSLNGIFIPLAKAEVNTGYINDFRFRTEATEMDANADMLLLYNDLKVSVLKDPETEEKKKFLTTVANWVIKSNNPDKKKSEPRVANIHIDRDPYHSSFNYFWQIIQPALVESVGVSQGKQNFVKKVSGFFTKVKNFFTGKKEEEKPQPRALPE